MATDLSSGENGSVPAERIPTIGPAIGAGSSNAAAAPPPSASTSTAAPEASAPFGSPTFPATAATQPIVVSADTQAKAEAAARIAAQSLGAPNLTKELAQLLAASIAQSQQTEAFPVRETAAPVSTSASSGAGTPTNAELASLSAIMAGTQSVRKPLPRFRDDLATLNYTRSQSTQASSAETSASATRPASPGESRALVPAGGAEPASIPQPLAPAQHAYAHNTAATFEAHHDDEPMPIPSTWREKSRHDEDRPLSRQLGAALVGLAAGLVVVVPAVLWLTGVIGPQGKRAETAAARATDRPVVKIRPIEPPTESATFYSNETPGTAAADPGPVTTASMARVAAPVDATQQIEQVLVQARQKIDGGDVAGARDLLAGEDNGSAAIAFALAETFDPNMLAAWGSRGITADVQRARALYGRALDMGYGRAMARLDALR